SYTTGGQVSSSPAVANGAVYVGSQDGNVYALNASTGAKLWSFATATGNQVSSSPAVANGVVYFGSDDPQYWSIGIDSSVYALNASTGAKLWSYVIVGETFDSSGAFISSPAIVDGVLYIHTQDGAAELYDGAGTGQEGSLYAFELGNADLFLRIRPTTTTVHQGDLITYAFPVWNLGPSNANFEVLNTQVPAGTVFDYIRISGTPGLGTCTHTPYLGAGPIPIVCHENAAMPPNTTWTVRLTVKVTAPAGTVITESAATMADTPDPNMANNKATVSLTVVP
ncbi:MAG: PQQ-binding-like beta-propeller repeat protein, partial [Alloacidobacterium sp.]